MFERAFILSEATGIVQVFDEQMFEECLAGGWRCAIQSQVGRDGRGTSMSSLRVTTVSQSPLDRGVLSDSGADLIQEDLAEIVDLDAFRRNRGGRNVPTGSAVSLKPAASLKPGASPKSAAAPTHSSQLDFVRLAVRAAMWVLVMVAALSIALGLGMALRPSAYSGQTWLHPVSAGESVWALAESIESPRPLEDVVADIVQLNSLDDMTIHPGQELILPAE